MKLIISIEINIRIKISVELHQFLQPGHLWSSLLALQSRRQFKPCMCLYMYWKDFINRKQHAAAFFYSGFQFISPPLSTLGDPETFWAHQKAGNKLPVLHLQLTDFMLLSKTQKILVCFRDLKLRRKHWLSQFSKYVGSKSISQVHSFPSSVLSLLCEEKTAAFVMNLIFSLFCHTSQAKDEV